MNIPNITALSAVIGLSFSAVALGGTLSEAQYKSAKEGFSTRFQADEAACQAKAGNSKDVCMAEASGRESVAKAELEASYAPSDEHGYDVRIAKSHAAFMIANEKCDDLAGNAQDVCRKEATSADVAARADAESARTTSGANATAKDASTEAGTKAANEKRDAAYAVAKEKCDSLAEDAKATCVKEAKARFGQS